MIGPSAFRNLLLFFVFLFFTITSHSNNKTITNNRTLKVIVLKDFPPLYQMNKNEKLEGFGVQFWEAIAKRKQIQTQYIMADNWEAATQLLRTGQGDLIVGAALTANWEKEFLFTSPILINEVSCFKLSESKHINNCDEFKNLKIGVIQKGAAHQFFEKILDKEIVPVSSLEDGIIKLLSKETDLFVAPKFTVIDKLVSLNLKKEIQLVGTPLMEIKRTILIRKDLQSLFEELNLDIIDFLKSKEYQTLYNAHFELDKETLFKENQEILFFSIFFLIVFLTYIGLRRSTLLDSALSVHSQSIYNSFIALVLFIMIFSTYILLKFVLDSEREKVQDTFELKVNELSHRINTQIESYKFILNSARGLFMSSKEVTAVEWKDFVENLNINKNLSGIMSMGYAPLIEQSSKSKHVSKLIQEGIGFYKIFPSTNNDHLLPITFNEPYDSNNQLYLGFDFLSHPVLSEAINRSISSNEIIMSGKVKVLDSNKVNHSPLLFLFIPFYNKSFQKEDGKESHSLKNITGVLFISFQIENLINNFIGVGIPQFEIEVFEDDRSDPSKYEEKLSLLFTTENMDRKSNLSSRSNPSFVPLFRSKKTLLLSNKKWIFHIQSKESFENQYSSKWKSTQLFVALVLDLVFVIFIIISIKRQHLFFRKYNSSQKHLVHQEQFVKHVIDDFPETIFQLDQQGVIIYINSAWKELSQYTPFESKGKLFLQYLEPQSHIHFENVLSRLKGIDSHFEKIESFLILDTMPSVKKINIYLYPSIDLNGIFTGVFGVILESKEKTIVQESLIKEEELVQSKIHFIYKMMNEVFSPIQLLKEDLQILESQSEPHILEKKILTQMKRRIEYILTFFRDFKELSLIFRGRLTYESSSVEYSKVIEWMDEEFKSKVHLKGLQWRIQMDEKLKKSFQSDWKKIQVILKNLLENALSFTESGYISVQIHPPNMDLRNVLVEKWGLSTDVPLICISITDTGIGIPENKKSTIFESFRTLDNGAKNSNGSSGIGIGLYIADQYAKFIGGSIHIQSRSGFGSTFTLIFPENERNRISNS